MTAREAGDWVLNVGCSGAIVLLALGWVVVVIRDWWRGEE